MDEAKLAASVLSQINDGLAVTPYGHGHLVSIPLHYSDGDRVKLFVEPYQQGIRVTDRGATLMRLNMADLSMTSSRVKDAWSRSLVGLDLFNPIADDQIAAFGPEEAAGELIIKVAEATMRIDQLRWLATDHKPVRFPERVVSRLVKAVGRPEEVLAQAPLPQKSGRTRRVTAAVGMHADSAVYVQAIGGRDREAREKSVEHCFYLFQLADRVPRQRTLAVAAGTKDAWDYQVIQELETVADIAYFDEVTGFNRLLSSRLQATF